MKNPFDIVKDFEAALCEYTGAPYAVAVNSCTMALLLAVKWHLRDPLAYPAAMSGISIPKRTYVSVPMSIIHAGGRPVFRDEEWLGMYHLRPLPVWDSARAFYRGMYFSDNMICVSFHTTKILGDTQGGAILHDNPDADKYLRRMRFDGRCEGVSPINDVFDLIGYHCYISPDVATRLLWKMNSLPNYNEPLPNDNYRDLSKLEIFK